MENLIECTNLTHYYGKRLIYRDLNFSVPKGRILGLLGKNGTGKTTTINILSGYLKPYSGDCLIFGQPANAINPEVRKKIGLLIEGHVQYQFMNISQIEKFYSAFYPGQWKKEAYYELMNKLKVSPSQKINKMSNGQRSQVALGLILAQNPELLVLDDFSLGLDPGYRRLFVEYLRDYAKSEGKTVFLTSHIIQDMENLVDDCIIMDYGKILVQMSVSELLSGIRLYRCSDAEGNVNGEIDGLYHPEFLRDKLEFCSFKSQQDVEQILHQHNICYSAIESETINLEDAFIGLTGKY
ncbi:MAG: ABC transporter ATP-binding protein [Bacteroidales bacterium]|nr:ABC transporter ATP-binding protein [Bacteroidales bacterium]